MMGFAGQLSLGHALYVGLGAYATAALYVHFGIGPWIGLPAAIADRGALPARSSASSRSASASPASISPSSPSPSPSSRASASTTSTGSAARRGLFLPVAQLHPQRPLEPARQADDVLLRDAGADRRGLRALPCAAAQPHRLLLAGDPRGRGGGARRSASTPSATRCIAVVISAGMTVARRRVLRVLLQQPVSRAGLPHLALDRADPGADHRRHRHAVRPDRRRLPAHRACPRRCTELLRALGIDVPGAKQVFYGVCLLVVVMVLPDGVWPSLARKLAPRPRNAGAMTWRAAGGRRASAKSFRGLRAVADVSFAVPEGAIFAVIGPNGAGKTTLFNMIAGVFAPDAGAIAFRGRAHRRAARPTQVCRRGIGRTFQLVRPFPALTRRGQRHRRRAAAPAPTSPRRASARARSCGSSTCSTSAQQLAARAHAARPQAARSRARARHRAEAAAARRGDGGPAADRDRPHGGDPDASSTARPGSPSC